MTRILPELQLCFKVVSLLLTVIRPTYSTGNMTCLKSCKIYLRHDQTAKDVDAHCDSTVVIYAPTWVQEGLRKLGTRLQGTTFTVFEPRRGDKPLQQFSIGPTMSLSELQKISRNEESNVSGIINFALYSDGGLEDKEALFAMKDLVRQSIIVGRDRATHYGGYPSGTTRVKLKSSPQPVYVCDLAGLQFQRQYNTGRLILIHKGTTTSETEGLLDDFIFENVVGEKKKLYDEAKDSNAERYISVAGFKNVPCLFDVYAYHRFIANDVVLAGLAIADVASKNGHQVVLKFLKYGTGFFAGRFGRETNNNILQGVVNGLEVLFSKHGDQVLGTIQHLEFPFYTIEERSKEKLDSIRDKYNVSYSFSRDDALKPIRDGLVVGTTNCADSMAVLGNEMHFSSVDAEIAENLESKGAIFCPILNPEMKEKFFDIKM